MLMQRKTSDPDEILSKTLCHVTMQRRDTPTSCGCVHSLLQASPQRVSHFWLRHRWKPTNLLRGRRGATVNYYYGAVRCLLDATLRLYKIPLSAVSYSLSYSFNTSSSSLNISPFFTNLTFFLPDSFPISSSSNSIPSQLCFRFLPSYSPLSPPYNLSTNPIPSPLNSLPSSPNPTPFLQTLLTSLSALLALSHFYQLYPLLFVTSFTTTTAQQERKLWRN